MSQAVLTAASTPRSRSWLRMRAIARRHAYVLVRSPHRLFDVTLHVHYTNELCARLMPSLKSIKNNFLFTREGEPD